MFGCVARQLEGTKIKIEYYNIFKAFRRWMQVLWVCKTFEWVNDDRI